MNNIFSFIKVFIQIQEGDSLFLYWAKEILAALLIFAIFWLLSGLVVKILNKWGKSLTSFTSTELDDRLLSRITPHISRLFIIMGSYLAIRSLPLNEKLLLIVSGLIYLFLVLLICTLIYHIVDEVLKWYTARQEEASRTVLSRQLVPIAEKLISLLLLGTALIIVLKHFNIDIFSLVTALGIGSLAIGMAAKDTLAHMISGFTIMLDRPFRIGDRIQLIGGQLGDVIDIGLRSTKIKTLDNQLLIIPNSDLCNTMLTNQAFPNVRVKGRINISVAYGSDVDMVKSLLVSTALEIDTVLAEPLPEAFLVSFGDFALNMSLFFWVEDYATLFATTDSVNTAIIKRFRENNVEIPFPVRTIIMGKNTTDI